MLKLLGCAVFLLGVSFFVGCGKSGPIPAKSNTFTRGQVWKYRTRQGEQDSRVIVGRIDSTNDGTVIIHIKVIGLSLKSPRAPGGITHVIQHLPMAESALRSSVTEVESTDGSLDDFQEGYDAWLEAYKAKGAGAFTIPVSKLIDMVESTICK